MRCGQVRTGSGSDLLLTPFLAGRAAPCSDCSPIENALLLKQLV
jgi:hypothetical protein